ncbi:hypothetical protein [Actinosynnema sp. NPDC020468]|uniref:hypothetical protein n=1 Tax=Actinosynnema sp. NPDC020468 TaxID=3154488 RepID=UPI0033C6063F
MVPRGQRLRRSGVLGHRTDDKEQRVPYDITADPGAIKHVSRGFSEIGSYLGLISEDREERIRLLKEACGGDEMGLEILGQLLPVVETTEEAVLGCGLAVANTRNVMDAMADKLAHTELDVLDNLTRRNRR